MSLDHDPRLGLVGSRDDVAVIEPNPALHPVLIPHTWAAYRNLLLLALLPPDQTVLSLLCDEKSRSYREEVSKPLEPSCGLAPIQSSDVHQIRTCGRVIDRAKLR